MKSILFGVQTSTEYKYEYLLITNRNITIHGLNYLNAIQIPNYSLTTASNMHAHTLDENACVLNGVKRGDERTNNVVLGLGLNCSNIPTMKSCYDK